MIPQTHNRRRYIRILYKAIVREIQPKVIAAQEDQSVDTVYHIIGRYGSAFKRRRSGEFWRIDILEAIHQ